jgi:hypothetical protein
MHTGYISFCDKVGVNIKSHETKEQIMKSVERFQLRIIKKHYEKLDEGSFFKLEKNPHMACLRSNGNPYYMFLTKHHFTNLCILIDRKIQSGYYQPRMIISKLRFSEELFEGTLFEGEMLKDMYGNWIYLIHDMIAYKGQYLENENFIKRLNMIYELLATQFIPDDLDNFCLQVKKYVPLDQIKTLTYEFMPSLPYTCRGMYFKPLYLRFLDILYNFDESLIKKVQRVKYQEDKEFVVNKDIEQLKKSEGLSSTTLSSTTLTKTNTLKRTPSESSNDSNHSLPPPSAGDTEKRKVCYLEKTHVPDNYKLYDDEKHCLGYAAVITKEKSKLLQRAFRGVNVSTRLRVECMFNTQFKRWEPQQLCCSDARG